MPKVFFSFQLLTVILKEIYLHFTWIHLLVLKEEMSSFISGILTGSILEKNGDGDTH